MRIPIIMMTILIALSFVVDGAVWLFLRRTYPQQTKVRRGYFWSAIACWIFLAVILCLPRRGESSILPVMWCLYGYLTIYISKIIYAVIAWVMTIPMLWGMRTARLGSTIALPVGMIVFLIMWWGALFGRQGIEVNYFDMRSEKIPASFNGYRIVQFSDAHVGTWGADTTFVSRFVDQINALIPDLILFTGDIVNRESEELRPFLNVLSRLHAKDGVYSVLGNHDYGMYREWNSEAQRDSDVMQLNRWQEKMGWRVLNNEHNFIARGRDSIAIIGVENWGEPPFGQMGDLDKAYPRAGEGYHHQQDSLFKVLLSHNPEHWNQVVSRKSNIDLTLAGHTHAMQFMIKIGNWKWSPAMYKYDQWAGDYTRPGVDGKPVTCYVNVGSGEVGMPFRIGATPEITLITLSTPTGK